MIYPTEIGRCFQDDMGHAYWHYGEDRVLHVLHMPGERANLHVGINLLNEEELRYQLMRKAGRIQPVEKVQFDKAMAAALGEMGFFVGK